MIPINSLIQSYPKARKTLKSIANIHQLVDSFEIAPFVEPRSLFDLGKKPQPLFLTVDLIATWIQHVSHGTRVRLRSLETGFLSELDSGRFMSAMVLARSHMENAGLAAFIEQVLIEASDTDNWDLLKPIIQQTLFGTSFRFEEKLTELQEELPLESTFPIKPKALLKAMDNFLISIGSQNSQMRGVYALLCEYTHPNIGGSKAFEKIVTHENDAGWTHYYRYREEINDNDIVTAADIMLVNMKIGYANVLLLVSGEIEKHPKGFTFHKPSVNVGNAIWDEIMQA